VGLPVVQPAERRRWGGRDAPSAGRSASTPCSAAPSLGRRWTRCAHSAPVSSPGVSRTLARPARSGPRL